MKIMIAVPCMDQVPYQFAQSLAMLNKAGDHVVVAFETGSLIYMARDHLAKKAIEMEADYVMWFDSDMVFEPDTLQKLIEDTAYGDIVSGVYYRRVSPFTPVMFSELEVNEMSGGGDAVKPVKEIPDEIFEVAGVGFGCVLTSVDVFMDVLAKYKTLFAPYMAVGEDLAFCWRARQCGYRIFVDPRVQCGHVGHHVVTKEFYEAYTKGGGTA